MSANFHTAKISVLKTRSENLVVPIVRSPHMEAQQDCAWQVLPHFAVYWVSLHSSLWDHEFLNAPRKSPQGLHSRP